MTADEHGRVPALLLEWRETPNGWQGRVGRPVLDMEAGRWMPGAEEVAGPRTSSKRDSTNPGRAQTDGLDLQFASDFGFGLAPVVPVASLGSVVACSSNEHVVAVTA